MLNVGGAEQEINPPYGTAPVIDGIINKSTDEWDEALKISINVYNNESTTDDGIPMSFWVMQSALNLYILIKFDLEQHDQKHDEFIGLIISESVSDDHTEFLKEDFVDGKIIQFSNMTTGEYNYLDYNLDNYTFSLDGVKDGVGAAALELKTVTYEFSIPVNTTADVNDVFLDYGERYGFRILYGETDSYPASIKKYNTVIIKINYPDEPDEEVALWIIRVTVTSIVFGLIGVLFGFYVYKITLLKKKVERVEG